MADPGRPPNSPGGGGERHVPLSNQRGVRGKVRRWSWHVFALWALPALIVAAGLMRRQGGGSGAETTVMQGQADAGTRVLHLVGQQVQDKQAALLKIEDRGNQPAQDMGTDDGGEFDFPHIDEAGEVDTPGTEEVDTSSETANNVEDKPAAKAPWWEDVPFDIVVSWYNQSDPARRELYNKYNPNGNATYGTEPNMGEIYFCLASIQHYAPWVNKIFLVVPSHHHPRLDMFVPPLRDKIQVVNESEFIPAEYLPTFSSVVIESFLDRIPGISNYFMYTMDDVFFGRPFPKSSVFSDTPGVGAVHLMNWHYIAEPVPAGPNDIWRWPFYNTGLVLKEKFGEMPRLGWHAGYILTKSSYKVAWALYEKELKQSVTNKFRIYKPLNQGGYIVMHLLSEHIALHLGLQELRLAKNMNLGQVARGEYPEPDVITYTVTDCQGLTGLPSGLMQRREGDPSVTYVNFNKLQNSAEGGVKSLCSSIVEIIGDAFEERYRGCMCQEDEIGKACLGL